MTTLEHTLKVVARVVGPFAHPAFLVVRVGFVESVGGWVAFDHAVVYDLAASAPAVGLEGGVLSDFGSVVKSCD